MRTLTCTPRKLPEKDLWELRVYIGLDPVTQKQQYRTKRFRGGKREARAAGNAFVEQIVEEMSAPPPEPDECLETLGEVLVAYEEANVKYWTPAGRALHADFIHGYLLAHHSESLQGLTRARMTKILDGIAAGKAKTRKGRQARPGPDQVDRCRRMVAAAFAWAMESEPPLYEGINPAKLTRRDREMEKRVVRATPERPVMRVAEQWEVDRLVGHAWATGSDVAVLLDLTADNGLRRGELALLRESDFRPADNTLVVRRRASLGQVVPGTKNRKPERIIALSDRMTKVLSDHVAAVHLAAAREARILVADPYLFPSSEALDGSKPWSTVTLNRRIKALCLAVDIEPFGYQSIRKRVDTNLLEDHTPPQDFSEQMGHSVATAITNYSRSTHASRLAAVERQARRRAVGRQQAG